MIQVLYYSGDPVRAAAFGKAAASCGLSSRRILPSETGRVIGELVAGPGAFRADAFPHAGEAPRAAPPAFYEMPEMLLLADMTGGQMNILLAALREAGLGAVPLKAMLTAHNIFWTPYTLSRHLREEHETYMAMRNRKDPGTEPG